MTDSWPTAGGSAGWRFRRHACPGSGRLQLIRGGVAGAIWPGEGRGPIGGSAADLIHVNEAGFAVGHPDDDHAMMQKSGVEARNRGLLATVLRAGTSKNAPNLANEGTVEPKSAGLIEKIAHLAAHVSEASWRTENDSVGLRKLIDRGHWHLGQSGLGGLGTVFFEHIVRSELRHLIERDFCAEDLLCALGYCLGHAVNVPIHAMKNDLNLDAHRDPPKVENSGTETGCALPRKSCHGIAAFAPRLEAALQRPDACDAVTT